MRSLTHSSNFLALYALKFFHLILCGFPGIDHIAPPSPGYTISLKVQKTFYYLLRWDRIDKLCKKIRSELKSQLLPGQLGEFIQKWTNIEEFLLEQARNREKRVLSINEAIDALSGAGVIEFDLVYDLHELSKFRNIVVHEPKKITQEQIEERLLQVQEIYQRLLDPG